MPRGVDSGPDPRRRGDGSWKAASGWTSPAGPIVSHRTTGEYPYTHDAKVTQQRSGEGYSADVDYTYSATGDGIWQEHYVAGPYRTQHRAEVAGSTLVDRADAGKGTENYYAGDEFTSTEELKYDG